MATFELVALAVASESPTKTWLRGYGPTDRYRTRGPLCDWSASL
jgi:hypothetical protein